MSTFRAKELEGYDIVREPGTVNTSMLETYSKSYKGPVYYGPKGGKYRDPQHKIPLGKDTGGGGRGKVQKEELDKAKPKKTDDKQSSAAGQAAHSHVSTLAGALKRDPNGAGAQNAAKAVQTHLSENMDKMSGTELRSLGEKVQSAGDKKGALGKVMDMINGGLKKMGLPTFGGGQDSKAEEKEAPTRPEVVRDDSEQRQRFGEAASFGINDDHKEVFERAKSLHKEAMELAQSGKLDYSSGKYLEIMLNSLTSSHQLSEAQITEAKKMFDDIRGSDEINRAQPAYGGDHWHSKGEGGDSSGLSSDKASDQKKHIYETADMVDGIKSYTEGYSDKGIEGVGHVDKEKLKKATDRVNADHLAIVSSLSSGKKLDGDVRERHKSHIDTLVGHGSISEATAKSMKAELKAQAKPDSRPNRWDNS